MYYVPNDSYPCYVVQDSNTIRAYHTQPRNNSNSNYTDYYVNSHYMEKSGNQTWSTTATLPSCLSKSNITSDFYYRNDLSDIMIIFFIFVIFGIYLPIKLFSKLFKRGSL